MSHEKKGTKFNIVTHSMGSYVAYKALQMEVFPADNLNSLTNLAGPIGRPPHFLSGSL